MEGQEEAKTQKIHEEKRKVGFGLVETILIIIITAIMSCVATWVIFYSKTETKPTVNCAELAKDEELNEFLQVYSEVTNKYYEKIDKKAMLESAIDGMMNYLGDSYTTLLNEEDTKELSDSLSGIYKGIGVWFKDKVITKVYENTPAANSGLEEGDKILYIDEKDASNMSDTEVSTYIKSRDNVKLIIGRDGKKKEFNITLKTINYPAISFEVEDGGIGYIYISTFSNTVASQFKSALDELEKQSINSLIIDVRDNAGGYLNACSDIAELFIEKGKTLYSLSAGSEVATTSDATETKRDYPIVVLINKNSASASEILAAALKDSYGATLVGEKSYGKGKVQQTQTLSDGSMIKYTSAKWLRPNGECIDNVGITPDYPVEVEYKYNEKGEVEEAIDTQLEKAIELLK